MEQKNFKNETENTTSTEVEVKKILKPKRNVIDITLDENAQILVKSDFRAVGYEITANKRIEVKGRPWWNPFSRAKRTSVGTGIHITLPTSLEAKIEPVRDMSLNGMEGVSVSLIGREENHGRFDCDVLTGKVSPGYHGEIQVVLRNNDKTFFIERGTKIAQLTLYKVNNIVFWNVQR